MDTLDANSPEGKLAATAAELVTAKADLAALRAELAKCDSATLRAELATVKTEKQRLETALAAANARLAAKGEAPSLTIAEQVRARANENAAKATASLPTGTVLTKAEKDNLYEAMSRLPAGEQRAFYERNIKGKIAA